MEAAGQNHSVITENSLLPCNLEPHSNVTKMQVLQWLSFIFPVRQHKPWQKDRTLVVDTSRELLLFKHSWLDCSEQAACGSAAANGV